MDGDLLYLDTILPTYDVNVVRHIVVDADPRTTYAALDAANLAGSPVARALVGVRDLPNRLRRLRRTGSSTETPAGPQSMTEPRSVTERLPVTESEAATHPANRPQPPQAEPSRITVRDFAAEEFGWVLLHDEAPVELALGLVGAFWRRDYGVAHVRADEFAGFAEPGYAKTVADLSLRPYGFGRTLLTYENRTLTTDEASRKAFRRYWLVLRPFVLVLMRTALVEVKQEAEGGRHRYPMTTFPPLPRQGGAAQEDRVTPTR